MLTRQEQEEYIALLERELRSKAKDDLGYYVRATMDLTPAAHHELLIHEGLHQIEADEIDILIVCMPPGSAKALALDTPIPTPNGWKQMGDLRVGDQVFDEHGRPCSVTWVSPTWKDRPVYKVRTDCGDEIIADRDHEWLVRLCSKRPVFKIKETHELSRKRSKRPMIQRAAPLVMPPVDLPIDPYVLGVWLGDGHASGLRITSAVDDQEWLREELSRLGYFSSHQSTETQFGLPGHRGKFVELGLLHDPAHATYGKKHIPEAYMRASVEQRTALLQGLIDTKVCVGYDLDGQRLDYLPTAADQQARCTPIYEELPGWSESTEGARSWAELPANAIKYVRRIEELIECPVALLSTSPEREDTILVTDPFAD